MQETASRRRSVGRVAPHAEVCIVGPDDVELPRGEVGEIAVRGASWMHTGGENLYSVEVEIVLARHPAVATVAVIGVPDDVYGERVHAVVVPAAGQSISLEELRAFCTDRIAGYKTPRSMEAVAALPTSAAGKVLKRELRQPYWADQERAVH